MTDPTRRLRSVGDAEVAAFFAQNHPEPGMAGPLVITLPAQGIQVLIRDNGRYLPDVDVRRLGDAVEVWTPLTLTGGTVERR